VNGQIVDRRGKNLIWHGCWNGIGRIGVICCEQAIDRLSKRKLSWLDQVDFERKLTFRSLALRDFVNGEF
jgi:hypothetical protein